MYLLRSSFTLFVVVKTLKQFHLGGFFCVNKPTTGEMLNDLQMVGHLHQHFTFDFSVVLRSESLCIWRQMLLSCNMVVIQVFKNEFVRCLKTFFAGKN